MLNYLRTDVFPVVFPVIFAPVLVATLAADREGVLAKGRAAVLATVLVVVDFFPPDLTPAFFAAAADDVLGFVAPAFVCGLAAARLDVEPPFASG